MIYTVTLNPSLDYIVQVKNFHTGILNRPALFLLVCLFLAFLKIRVYNKRDN